MEQREAVPGELRFGTAWMVFDAKGRAGVLTVTPKAIGHGYSTTYRVPRDLYKAHKVVAVTIGLAQPTPAAAIAKRYGRPDEIGAVARGTKRYRYWILVRRDERPDSLHAVDFEVDSGAQESRSYILSTDGADFVAERLTGLLREWERDYVLD